MRIVLSVVFTIALSALACMASGAETKEQAPRCDNCGMFMDKSATQVHATFEVDGVKHEHKFVCLGCVYEYAAEHYGGALPVKLQVLDYTTFSSSKLVLLDASKAWYLYGTSKLPGSMAPFIAAFATKAAAESQQDQLGGELLEFKAVQERLQKANAPEEEAAPHASAGDAEAVYVCPCTGGCCDGVRASEPGVCPQCGMELELKQG